MSASESPPPDSNADGRAPRRYVRPHVPIFFPPHEEIPRSRWRIGATELLAGSIEREFEGRALVSDRKLLYWDPTDPAARLWPDISVRRRARGKLETCWNSWDLGAPHLSVELLSESDRLILGLEETLARYVRVGAGEVVCFERDDPARPIRIWDFFDGDLVERDMSSPGAHFCDTLRLYWHRQSHPELGAVLRLTYDLQGLSVVPTHGEALSKETEL